MTEVSVIKGLHSLLHTTEQLLFSFPLSPDVVQKYEGMKQSVYAKLGIEYSHSEIWKLQREAHAKNRQTAIDKGVQVSTRLPDQEQLFALQIQELEHCKTKTTSDSKGAAKAVSSAYTI